MYLLTHIEYKQTIKKNTKNMIINVNFIFIVF